MMAAYYAVVVDEQWSDPRVARRQAALKELTLAKDAAARHGAKSDSSPR